MKALILAGGFGTRLQPLSYTRPKLMFPIANRPILEWTIESLSNYGIKDVILAVNYMADTIMRHFGDSWKDVKISYSKEAKPLGTGGPIKQAEQLLVKDSEEPFIVLNGDILSSINYKSLYHAHVGFGSKVTVALYEVDDPSRYGVVELDKECKILRFLEKPKKNYIQSNMINAGVYVVDPSVLEYIPPDMKVSLERQIFPMLTESDNLFGYKFDGFWIDIGIPADYLRANRMMLDFLKEEFIIRRRDIKIHPNAKLIPPNVLGKGVVIGNGSSIGPYVSLGNNVKVGQEVVINHSIFFEGTIIGDFSSVEESIIGEQVLLGKHVNIQSNCMIEDKTRVKDDVTISKNKIV